MSQQSDINNLQGGISDEDAKLVDSILNDLGQQPQQPKQQQMSPEQAQAMQQQQMMAQQQALQQQAMAQQQAMQQQAMAQQQQAVVKTGSDKPSVADGIKRESKSIIVIIFLCIVFNLGQIDGLFKKIGMFVSEDGSLNMQCVFVKALLVGSLYFVIKHQLL